MGKGDAQGDGREGGFGDALVVKVGGRRVVGRCGRRLHNQPSGLKLPNQRADRLEEVRILSVKTAREEE